MTTLRFRPIAQSQPSRLALCKSTLRGSLTDGTTAPRIAWAARTVARSRKSSPMSRLEQADVDRLLRQQSLFCAQRGDFSTALSGLNLLLSRYPHSAADYNNRGLVYFQSGKWDLALCDYDKALALDDTLANAYNNRANYYAAQGDLFVAMADYQTAIELDSSNIRAWINQGITFRELDMYIPALDNFEEALDLNDQEPDPGVYIFLSAHIYAERGRTNHLLGDWNCAMTDYYEAIAYLNHESQGHTYPPLWWQVDGWLGELMEIQKGVPEWGSQN